MKIQLKTLCENTASAPDITAEWGWSIFIEADGVNILFDTGGGRTVPHNAAQMGVDLQTIESNFYVMQNGNLVPDGFKDDLALILKTPQGLVIILGCAHRGIINTIRHARDITGVETVHMVIGGTHLFPKKDTPVEKTIKALKEFDIQNIGVSHCTGFKAAAKLSETFGDRFFLNNAGTVKTIE